MKDFLFLFCRECIISELQIHLHGFVYFSAFCSHVQYYFDSVDISFECKNCTRANESFAYQHGYNIDFNIEKCSGVNGYCQYLHAYSIDFTFHYAAKINGSLQCVHGLLEN